MPKKVIILGAIIAIIIVGVIAMNGIRTVGPGQRGVLLDMGKPQMEELGEGMHIINPFMQNVVIMPVQIDKIMEKAGAASKDLQDVATTVAVNYHIEPTMAAEIYQKLGSNYAVKVIQPTIQESVKQITAKYTASQLVTERSTVKNEITEVIETKLRPYNIIIDAVSIQDFRFGAEFSAAVEATSTERQQVLKAEQQLQRMEVEAKQRVTEAQGLANATIAKAEGEAQSIQIINDAIKSNPQYIEYQRIVKWDGDLPAFMAQGLDPLLTLSPEDINATATK